jgi:hypothetical protein
VTIKPPAVAVGAPKDGVRAGRLHCANRVVSAVIGVLKSNRAPPADGLVQPPKASPLREGSAGTGIAKAEHAITRETAPPPSESKVSVRRLPGTSQNPWGSIPTPATDAGTTSRRRELKLKALAPTSVTPVPTVTNVRRLSKNASWPIPVTVFGIEIEVSRLPRNALAGRTVTWSEIVSDVSRLSRNADAPMVVTLSGIVTELSWLF